MEHELLTLPEHLSSPPVFSELRVSWSLVLCACFVDRCLPFCSLFLWSFCCLFFFEIRIMITPFVSSYPSYCGVASTQGRLTTGVWHYLHLYYVVRCLDIWKRIPNGLSPICSLFVRGRLHTLASKEKRKKEKMYFTLQEWSMRNPRKFPRFILIRHPKWRSGGKAISSWMKLKKIK